MYSQASLEWEKLYLDNSLPTYSPLTVGPRQLARINIDYVELKGWLQYLIYK